MDVVGLKPNPEDGGTLSSFSALTLLIGWIIWPVKTVPDMTYNVFGGTLNLTDLQLLKLLITITLIPNPKQ